MAIQCVNANKHQMRRDNFSESTSHLISSNLRNEKRQMNLTNCSCLFKLAHDYVTSLTERERERETFHGVGVDPPLLVCPCSCSMSLPSSLPLTKPNQTLLSSLLFPLDSPNRLDGSKVPAQTKRMEVLLQTIAAAKLSESIDKLKILQQNCQNYISH